MAKDKDKKTKRAVSALVPVNRQGVKGVTLAQEATLVTVAHESGKYGSPWQEVKNNQYGRAVHHYVANMDPRSTWSAKVFWGATAAKIALTILRPGKPALRAGILQVS